MPKGDKLTVKQRKFIKEYVARDGNGMQAALAVYDTDSKNVAGVIADENLKKPNIREKIEQALIKLDLTPDYVLNKHKYITERYLDTDAMISERALENIGKIGGMYPSSTNSLEIDKDGVKLTWES